MIFDGGITVVDRLLKAYGFSTQKELVEKIGVGHGTVSTWIRRNHFPGEAVVQCALETGVSLEWLATGCGEFESGCDDSVNDFNSTVNNLISVPFKDLDNGRLTAKGNVLVASELISRPILEPELIMCQSDKRQYIIEKSFVSSTDGEWLIEKAGVISIATLKRIPGDCWRIETVDWPTKEVQLLGKVVFIIISKV
ncbi:phage repressor protein CI [Acerihabitans sp. TG2]|uniref:phage repressor protein CI n=1 Tax=Acerihabitans sp. TG2 TaxID=3096008 RepID=UPI002B2300B1|nr:phage repressor protein CI [Acerihabitans sp. TG2]MEA9393155.1 phage repressor protein CI [Acerihabitans sp. TG2]